MVVGGGRVGSYLAQSMLADGHRVLIIDKNPETCKRLADELNTEVYQGDACDPEQFEGSGVAQADLVAAVTGHDEDNLVISQLAKYTFKTLRVIARVNNPRNEWLFTKEWGVDVAVSAVHIIGKIIQEEATIGDIVTLLKFRHGKIALVEVVLPVDRCKVCDQKIEDLALPADCVIVGLIRGDDIIFPKGSTELKPGDTVIALTTTDLEKQLKEILV